MLLIPIGFAVGAFGTLIGAGGGFILVPVLLFLYPDEEPATITSISLAVVFFNALSGSWAYARQRRIDYRTGVSFAIATFPGAVLGALVVGALSRGVFDAIFGGVLVALAGFVVLRTGGRASRVPPRRPGMTTRALVDAKGVRYEYSFFHWHGLVISAGVGFLSSLLGIGGGIIHVPALVEFLNFPVHIATATSHFVLAAMAFEGTAVHLATGELGPGAGLGQALLLAVGVVPGAQLGARLSHHVHGGMIIRLLGVALFFVGLRLLLGSVMAL
ncbi:MAG: sulfite exporter TauE/SafE family protein [Dehalococcoidia bacterium]